MKMLPILLITTMLFCWLHYATVICFKLLGFSQMFQQNTRKGIFWNWPIESDTEKDCRCGFEKTTATAGTEEHTAVMERLW